MIKNSKKGISLIALAITILVSLILVSVAVAATGNAIENANITEYIDNLNLIKDSVESYYVSNGVFPVKNDKPYNQAELLEIISNSKSQGEKDTFIYDMRQNEDYYDDDNLGDFYIVDLAKIGIEKTEIGNGVKSNLDVFAFSYPSMNIYYLEGMELKKDIYFSLNKRLTYISNVSSNKDETDVSSKVKVETFEGITITRNNFKWTNELNLSITGSQILDGSVAIRLAGTNNEYTLEREISGDYVVNLIEDFNKNDRLTNTISAQDIQNFNLLSSQEKYIEIINKVTESRLKVSLSNYDNKFPSILSCTVTNNPEMSILSYSLNDFDSGIKEIRYEYLKKFDENGNIVDYYSNLDINKEYMLTKSKKIRAFGEKSISIKVPENVNMIKVYVIDNAGNITIEEDRVVKENYVLINANINYFYSDGFNFSLDVSGEYNSIETSVTTKKDSNLDYINTFNSVPKNIDYTGFTNGIDNLYLKVKVISLKNGKEIETVKNFKFDLIGNYPYIPTGFYYVGGTVDSGFVISDNENDKLKGDSFEVASSLVGNQFVWIPVKIDSSSIQNLKTKWYRVAYETGSEYTSTATRSVLDASYTEPLEFNGLTATSDERKLYNNVLSGIQKYKGFYVGRYETGAINITSPRALSSKNNTDRIGIKKDLYVYNFVPFGASMTDFSLGASYLANSMYNNSFVGSNLIFGIQWDHIMKFADKNVSNSIEWGNYLDSSGDAKRLSGEYDYKTGRNSLWCTKNIYDLAGNVSEWTMEAYSNSSRVTRGGNFSQNGTINSAGIRLAYEPGTASNLIGFRVCLYLK